MKASGEAQALHLADRICLWGESQPERASIVADGSSWSYRELAAEVDLWAARMRAAGLGPGDTVLVFLPQAPESIAVYFGLMRCGAVPSFMPLPSAKQEPGHYWRSHLSLLRLIRPAAVVTLRVWRGAMEEAGLAAEVPQLLATDDTWRALAPWSGGSYGCVDDVALLQHSSGTTSLKKGVQLTHRAVTQQIDAYARALDATQDDVVVSWLPIYHDMGLIACTMLPLLCGQKLVLLDPFRWVADPASMLRAISAQRGTLVWLPNFAFELLARAARFQPGELDLRSVRAFINCSEPCKAASFDRFEARFAPAGVTATMLQVCYAMAETVFAVSQTPLGAPARRITVDEQALMRQRRALVVPQVSAQPSRVLLSSGRLIDGMAAEIIDTEGRTLPPGGVGEIRLRSEFLFSGYLNRPELSRERLHGGGYDTRDLGFILDDNLYVLGRTDDLIIVHGRNYFAHEIEAVLNRVPGLKPGRNVAIEVFNETLGSADAVVIAELGEDGTVPADSLLALRRLVKHAVAQDMGLELHDVRLVKPGWLVKTTSGKISRELNRAKFAAEARSGSHNEPPGRQ